MSNIFDSILAIVIARFLADYLAGLAQRVHILRKKRRRIAQLKAKKRMLQAKKV